MTDTIVFLVLFVGYIVFSKMLLDIFEEVIYNLSRIKIIPNRVMCRMFLLILPIFTFSVLFIYSLYYIFKENIKPSITNKIKDFLKYFIR